MKTETGFVLLLTHSQEIGVPVPTYRRRPTEVVAIQVGSIPYKTLARWCGGEIIRDGNTIVGIHVPFTGSGMAKSGDWIIQERQDIASVNPTFKDSGMVTIYKVLADRWFQQEFERYYTMQKR